MEKIQVTCEMEVTLKMIGGKCKPLILDGLNPENGLCGGSSPGRVQHHEKGTVIGTDSLSDVRMGRNTYG